MQSALSESCREELPPDGQRCNAPAEFILWGKLLPREALGPRCYDHAAKHVGHRMLGNPASAIYDLRRVGDLERRFAEERTRAIDAETRVIALERERA